MIDANIPMDTGPIHHFHLTEKDLEINYLREQLAEALKLLKAGKAKFAPTTTNSDVDCFIAKHTNS